MTTTDPRISDEEAAKRYIDTIPLQTYAARSYGAIGFLAGIKRGEEKAQGEIERLSNDVKLAMRRSHKIGKIHGELVDNEYVKNLLLIKIPDLEEEIFNTREELTAERERSKKLVEALEDIKSSHTYSYLIGIEQKTDIDNALAAYRESVWKGEK